MRGSINGQIVRADNGYGVLGATITIVREDGSVLPHPVKTDEDGGFLLDRLPAGKWRLRVIGPTGSRAEVIVPVFENAVSSVTIALNGLQRWLATTLGGIADGSADVSSEDEPADNAQSSSSAGNPYAATNGDNEMAGNVRRHDMRSAEDFGRIAVGSVRGRVVRAGTELPVSDATISLVRGPGPAPDMAPITDQLGRFMLDGLTTGVWLLRAFAPHGVAGEAEVRISDDKPAELVIEVNAALFDDDAPAGHAITSIIETNVVGEAIAASGSILGRVVNRMSGMPVRFAEIVVARSVEPEPQLTYTSDHLGKFTVCGLVPGSWQLRAIGQDGEAGEAKVHVYDHHPIHAVIEVERLERSTIRGQVVCADTSLPVSGAAVMLLSGAGPVAETMSITDPCGRFSIPDLAVGTWLLRVRGPNGEETDVEVFVPAKSGVEDLRLQVSWPTHVAHLLGREHRLYREGDRLSDEYRERRVNIQLDRSGELIQRIWFG